MPIMFSFDPDHLRWMIPATLGIVLLIQLVYLAFLSRIPKAREVTQPPPVLPSVPPYTPPTAAPAPPAAPPAPAVVSTAPPAPVMPSAPASLAPAAAVSTIAPSPAPSVAAPRPIASAGIGKMLILAGVEGVSEIALPAKEFNIGRFYNPDNDILIGLDERSVSRKHARFIADDTTREYYIKDTASSFGTFLLINGQFEQLAANVQERVYNEDVIRFGNIVTVRLILPIETRGTVTSL